MEEAFYGRARTAWLREDPSIARGQQPPGFDLTGERGRFICGAHDL